ncbi:MAG TPA: DNA-3-methyladenine glycosylase [Candidatus Andersenbacteria bacterium]|nr:DNA-3-methyladenine glycosylase [Candidatus Andersenbacteria bacterium]
MRHLHPLPRSFYARDTNSVAIELLGKLLVRKKDKKIYIGRICEVESYIGEDDAASHASKGKTKRTEVMYEEAGHAYVYMIYGMYYCLNVVTEVENFPAAILIRACEPVENIFGKTDGPGKLCREFFIDRTYNRHDLTTSTELFIADDGIIISEKDIVATPRIGVAYAGDDAMLPWRYLYSK